METDEDLQKVTEANKLIAAGDNLRADTKFLAAVEMVRRVV